MGNKCPLISLISITPFPHPTWSIPCPFFLKRDRSTFRCFMTQEINFTLWFQGTKLVRTKVNVPVSLVVCLSQSFKFVHASKLAEAGFTEEVSSKMLSVNVLALELIASFFKATGVRQKGKQVASQQSWNHFIYQLHCLCTFDKINGLATDLAVLTPFYMIFWILILLFAWVGWFAILQVSLLLFIILNI